MLCRGMDEKKVKADGSDDRLAIGAIRRKESGIECHGNGRSRLRLKSLETNEGGGRAGLRKILQIKAKYSIAI